MKISSYNLFLGFLIFVCLILFLINNLSISGLVSESSTPSNVTVQKSLAIDFSTNLSDGILFGTVNVLPATNINASHNYDNIDNGSSFYAIVSEDSNVNVDFCIKANGNLTSSDLDVLGLGNETYSFYNSTNSTHPDLDLETSLTTSYVKSGEDIKIGENNYYRFWLDIPGAQPSGDYTNLVYFKGIQTGSSC
jgi:hypothetical protein